MLIIPGFIISILTFPGVIVHELAHVLFCRLRSIPVLEVRYFQVDMRVAGYVIHAEPEDYLSTFLISVGPFIVNTLLCMLICLPASFPFLLFDVLSFPNIVLLWLGVSIGMHAFPSTQDAKVLWGASIKAGRKGNLLAIIGFPVVALVYLANILSIFWFDAIYGVGIGLLLPALILK